MADRKDVKAQRKIPRLNVVEHRINATLALIQKQRTTGCLVPIKDISKNGAGIYTQFAIDLHTPIRLHFERFPYPPFEGKVAFCEPCGSDPNVQMGFTHRVGIEYTPADDTARENQLQLYNAIQELILKS